jgi:purine-binding chemotaxis protein CheW
MRDDQRVCLFEVAGDRFGLRLESVREIVPMASLSCPPSMPAILEGFLNLRGDAVPVLRLARLLGLPQDELAMHTPLIVLRGGDLPVALLVSRVTAITPFPMDGVVQIASSDSFNGCVDGRLPAAGDPIHLLSPEKLLLEKERRILREFQETEAGRLRLLEQAAR